MQRGASQVFRKSYYCNNCTASVGVHHNDKFPLGKMETRAVRNLRYRVHKYINQFHFTQNENNGFYKNVQAFFNILEKKAHIAMLTEVQLGCLLQLFQGLTLTPEAIRGILTTQQDTISWSEFIIQARIDNSTAPDVQGYNRTE